MVNDVKRAYFYAEATSPIYVEIPDEDMSEQDRGQDLVGRLNLSMYGTREAAKAWQSKVATHLQAIGFKKGRVNPCIFWHASRDIRTLVHGDNYFSSGCDDDLEWLRDQLSSQFDIKTTIIGPGCNQEKEMKILNRVVRFEDHTIVYEADQRHAEIMVETLKLGDCNPLATPAEDRGNDEEQGPECNEEHKNMYKSLVARANFLSPDRMDIQYATTELCRRMACPTERDWLGLKRLVRYLRGGLGSCKDLCFREVSMASWRIATAIGQIAEPPENRQAVGRFGLELI